MKLLKKYIKPKSLTWWSAIAEALINVARVAGIPVPHEVDLIIASLIAIGLRSAK